MFSFKAGQEKFLIKTAAPACPGSVLMPERVRDAAELVWSVVAAIPAGRVATYGQIARLAGMPNQSRLVGKVLSRLPPGSRLPWHRVINAQGRISNPNACKQRDLLEAEGIVFISDRVRLSDFQWTP